MVFHHFTSMVGVIEEETSRDKAVDGRHSHLKAEKKFLSNLDKHINKNMEEDAINPTEKIGTLLCFYIIIFNGNSNYVVVKISKNNRLPYREKMSEFNLVGVLIYRGNISSTRGNFFTFP